LGGRDGFADPELELDDMTLVRPVSSWSAPRPGLWCSTGFSGALSAIPLVLHDKVGDTLRGQGTASQSIDVMLASVPHSSDQEGRRRAARRATSRVSICPQSTGV
jgi:hypothetical protein